MVYPGGKQDHRLSNADMIQPALSLVEVYAENFGL